MVVENHLKMAENQYTEENIRSLDWKEHIRLRPGMYIGKLGDGSSADDGIYILVKEVVDNCIDEFVMGNGRRIEIKITEGKVAVRDYGRGIPLGKVKDVERHPSRDLWKRLQEISQITQGETLSFSSQMD